MRTNATLIEGSILLRSPLHVSAGQPNTWGANDQHQIVRYAKGTTPLTRTVHYRLTLPLLEAAATGAHGGEMELPYFPANDFRGRLRRMASKRIEAALNLGEAGGQQISLAAYYLLRTGSSPGRSMDKGDQSLLAMHQARQHLYLGLFGGGPNLIASGYEVADAIPITNETIAAALVPERFTDVMIQQAARNIESAETGAMAAYRPRLTHVYMHTKVDDVLLYLDPAADRKILNYAEAIKALNDDIDENVEARTARQEYTRALANYKAAKRRGDSTAVEPEPPAAASPGRVRVGTRYAVEAVRPGIHFYFRLVLQPHLSAAQKGLLVLSLKDLFEENSLGGLIRCGMGSVKANLQIRQPGKPAQALFESPRDEDIYHVQGDAKQWVEAANEALGQLKLEDVEALLGAAEKEAA